MTTFFKTWGEAVEYDLLRNKSHGKDRASHDDVVHHLDYFTACYGKSFPCMEITQDVIDDMQTQVMEERNVVNATANRYMASVKAVLNFAYSKRKLPHSFKFIKLKENKGRPNWYDKSTIDAYEQVARSLNFCRDDLADIAVFGAYVGARQAEILNLRSIDIDLDAYDGRGSIYIGGRPGFSTKNDDWREVPMHTKVRPIILKRINKTHPNTLIFGHDWANKDKLLREFKKVLVYLEQPPVMNFHHLRHSFGVWHAEAGTPIRTLMELMGHKTIETTIMYAKVSNKARADAMANI